MSTERASTPISLPQVAVAAPQVAADPPQNDRQRFTRWRVRTLVLVHVLIAIHVTQWLLFGRTLAPLELNEAVYTLEVGIVTAGAILMGLAVMSVLVFGRFFCSWGCHVLALQDGAAWLLRTLHVPARPVRSRALLLIAPVAMLYMFVWPQVVRLWQGVPLPGLHLRDDAGGWASFMTEDFTRNLPGPGVAIATLLTCGGIVVWVLGTRSFCQFMCPYGALFRVVEPLAPGRIKADTSRCTSCGLCTAVCESHVRVHEEIQVHGRVVDSMCLKDLDCVQVCPENALSFGMTTPAGLNSLRPARGRIAPEFTWAEEGLIAVCALAGTLSFRGLYGIGPFFLSMALGALIGFAAVLIWRLTTRTDVRFSGVQLKRWGALRREGAIVASVCAVSLGLLGHSAFIRFHEWSAHRELARASEAYMSEPRDAAVVARHAQQATAHLDVVERWGLMRPLAYWRSRGAAAWGEGDHDRAEEAWLLAVAADAADHDSRENIAALRVMRASGSAPR